jgi:hypothetical protein
MNSKGILLFGGVSIPLLLGTIGILLMAIHTQNQTLAALEQEASALEQTRKENETLSILPLDMRQLQQLRVETADLPKLRNEARELREEARHRSETEAQIKLHGLVEEQQRLQLDQQTLANLPARAGCIRNLEQIDLAKIQWAKVYSKPKGTPVRMEDLAPLFPNGASPVCPAGGRYSPNRVGAAPVCSVAGHAIP